MKKLCFLLLITSVFFLVSCGDSNNDDTREVFGTWNGAVTKISDTCGARDAATTLLFNHAVVQNEGAVNLQTQSGVAYLGNVVGGDGFSVDATSTTFFGLRECKFLNRIAYNRIDEDTDLTADVEFTTLRDCAGEAQCRIEYTGTASRTFAFNPTPLPILTPPGTPQAFTGGCFSVNQTPPTKAYSGNGGCGISTSGFNLQDNVVSLVPFGANGATSFPISSANNFSASSTNLDLTIRGVSGNRCLLTCSPPSTFTLTCFRGAATQCIEKF